MALLDNIRVGQGVDFHRFIAPGDHVVIGGVKIDFHHRLEGHSDADVLTHAVMDAILGAAGFGDIGQLFPNTDQKWKGASSLIMLDEVIRLIEIQKWVIINLDCTILAESPKISPHCDKIKQTLSKHLKITADRIGIKATTTESMGAIGRSEGMMASAVVLLSR